jgi:hypothetical protein
MPFADADALVPSGLATDEFELRPLRAADAAADHAAVMDTRDDLRVWEQSTWPEDDFSVDANREDLTDLERRHDERRAFTYTVLDAASDECLGCVYLFPTRATFLARSEVVELGTDRWDDVDVVAYFWVRRSRVESGMEQRLVDALRSWLSGPWGFDRVVFATARAFARQVGVLSAAGLVPAFELREPDKPGTYLLFA